jgi:hypothetical protein
MWGSGICAASPKRAPNVAPIMSTGARMPPEPQEPIDALVATIEAAFDRIRTTWRRSGMLDDLEVVVPEMPVPSELA